MLRPGGAPMDRGYPTSPNSCDPLLFSRSIMSVKTSLQAVKHRCLSSASGKMAGMAPGWGRNMPVGVWRPNIKLLSLRSTTTLKMLLALWSAIWLGGEMYTLKRLWSSRCPKLALQAAAHRGHL